VTGNWFAVVVLPARQPYWRNRYCFL